MRDIKHPVDVSGGIEVGGFLWDVDGSRKAGLQVARNSNLAECKMDEGKISIDTNWPPVRVSESFLHEVIHAVSNIYLHSSLKERDVSVLSYGLHQVMESLGVRFVFKTQKGKE